MDGSGLGGEGILDEVLKTWRNWPSPFHQPRCPFRASADPPPGCTVTPDPRDPCCAVPMCPSSAVPMCPSSAVLMCPSSAVPMCPSSAVLMCPSSADRNGTQVMVPSQGQGPLPGHPFEGCVHKNKTYARNEFFYDGCEQHCQCMGCVWAQAFLSSHDICCFWEGILKRDRRGRCGIVLELAKTGFGGYWKGGRETRTDMSPASPAAPDGVVLTDPRDPCCKVTVCGDTQDNVTDVMKDPAPSVSALDFRGSDPVALPSTLPVSSTENPLPTISLGLSKTTASAVELILNLPKTAIVALRDGPLSQSDLIRRASDPIRYRDLRFDGPKIKYLVEGLQPTTQYIFQLSFLGLSSTASTKEIGEEATGEDKTTTAELHAHAAYQAQLELHLVDGTETRIVISSVVQWEMPKMGKDNETCERRRRAIEKRLPRRHVPPLPLPRRLRGPRRCPQPLPRPPPPASIGLGAYLRYEDLKEDSVRIHWRTFTRFELRFIDGVQLRFRDTSQKSLVWTMTPLLHRELTEYRLSSLKPNTQYEVDITFLPFANQTRMSCPNGPCNCIRRRNSG
ncbi:unnamed protein product, partial [Cyprideis torosa]